MGAFIAIGQNQLEPSSSKEPARLPERSETLEELFSALESPLLKYAYRLLWDGSAAEDIVQEAFMRLHGQFAEVREHRSWLYRTVHNLALNHNRRTQRTSPLPTGNEPSEKPPPQPTDPQPLPDEQLARWEGIGLVRLRLQQMDARSRELIQLKFNEDLTYQQISARTGLTQGNVGYLLHHALKAMAEELAKIGVFP